MAFGYSVLHTAIHPDASALVPQESRVVPLLYKGPFAVDLLFDGYIEYAMPFQEHTF